MKKLFAITIVVFSLSLAAAAQRQKADPGDIPAPDRGKPSKTAAQDESKPLILTNTELEATLMKSLDIQRSKVGDEVILKTTKSIKQNGEVVIPKGSRLIGRITEVQQKGESKANSRLGLIFERVEGKGFSAPITASLMSITDARAAATLADSAMADVSGSSMTGASVSRGSSRGGGGGLLGGVGSTVGGVGSTVGGVVNGATQTVGSVAGTAVNTTSSTVGTVGGTLRGIQITQSASGSANGSAVLTTNDKSLKIDKGVTFNLLVSGSTAN
ncbi:MAG: hypothetical protein KF762_03595 [Acidobacteria bacterium]|nr:hypothetical protein [Acidobacteriota bacterium]